ncbi:hypothetical protein ACWKWP_01680 [Agromyces soli]
METAEFFDLFEDYWGQRASNTEYASQARTVSCILYDAFPFRCGLNGEHNTFQAGFPIGGGAFITRVLGQDFSLNTDAESILQSFGIADAYCRIRLGAEYLEAFEIAYGIAPKPATSR